MTKYILVIQMIRANKEWNKTSEPEWLTVLVLLPQMVNSHLTWKGRQKLRLAQALNDMQHS